MKQSNKIALAMTVLAVLWMASGVLTPEKETVEHTVAQEKTETPTKIQVKIEDMEAQYYVPSVTVNGRTEASKTVTVRAETEGRVTGLAIEKGAQVKRGQVLARIDLRDRRERVTEAQERLKQAQVEHEAASVLQSEGFNSKIRVAQKRAELESARAALKEAQTELTNTTITAPLDGIVADKTVETGDYVRGGDALAMVVSLNPIKIAGSISETDVVHARVGAPATATLPDGKTLAGKITFVSPVAEERTRTFPVEIEAANADSSIIAGLTASVLLPLDKVQAYRISSSSLALDDAGRVGVKVVDEQNLVHFLPVRLLSDKGDAVWVGGLPARIRLITSGQAFVTEGQSVQ